jgi:hypothetical protein
MDGSKILLALTQNKVLVACIGLVILGISAYFLFFRGNYDDKVKMGDSFGLSGSVADTLGVSGIVDSSVQSEEDVHKQVILKLNIKKDELPRGEAEYMGIADIQYNAMNRWGTDETKIKESLKGLNQNELKTVFMYFGRRASTSIFNRIPISARRNLIEWYQAEIEGQDLKDVADIWKGVFTV